MAMPSAYKANHQNNFRFDPIQTKHTSIMDGLMKIYGTWKAIPADIRYAVTGSDRDLNEAIADGSMNAAGEDATGVGAFRKWQEKNPDGTYEDYAKYKKAQELADFKSKWDIVNGKGEEKTTETTTTTDANGNTEGTTTETTKEEGEPEQQTTYEWDTSNGLPTDNDLELGGYSKGLYNLMNPEEPTSATNDTVFGDGDGHRNSEARDYEESVPEEGDEATFGDKVMMMGLNPDLDTSGYLANPEDEEALYYGGDNDFTEETPTEETPDMESFLKLMGMTPAEVRGEVTVDDEDFRELPEKTLKKFYGSLES